jgi:carboxyl-terminal processing protease
LLAVSAILAGCGRPAWPGGIHANLAWSPRGVRVVEVPDGSPAEKAGLLPDDRLLSIDGEPVQGLPSDAVQKRLSGEVGSWVTLVVLRREQPVELRIERVPYGFAQ